MSQKGRVGTMRNRAQIMVEYSVLIGIIVAALISMQVYVKRAVQGRIRSHAEQLSGGYAYSPGAMNSASVINRRIQESTTSEGVRIDDGVRGSATSAATNVWQDTNRTEEILPLSAEPQR